MVALDLEDRMLAGIGASMPWPAPQMSLNGRHNVNAKDRYDV